MSQDRRLKSLDLTPAPAFASPPSAGRSWRLHPRARATWGLFFARGRAVTQIETSLRDALKRLDIKIRPEVPAWGKCKVEIWTHKIGGLTESDFYFAAKADRALMTSGT